MRKALDRQAFFRKKSEVIIVYTILLAIILAGALSNPRFLTGRNIGNLLEQSMALGFVALGQMLVILLGGIDLSVGTVISLTVCILSHSTSTGLLLRNLVFALVAGCLVGYLNGLGVVRFKLPPFIMTLATMSIVNGAALLIRPVPGGSVPYGFSKLLNGRLGIVPHAAFLYLLLFLLLYDVLYKRTFGRSIYAVGGNRRVADLSGIRSEGVIRACYILSSLFAVLAGSCLSARMGTGDAALGNAYGMDSITVCVLGGVNLFGGRGRLVTLPAATLTLCMMSNILNMMAVQSYYQYVLKGAVLLFAVLLYSLNGRGKRKGAVLDV